VIVSAPGREYSFARERHDRLLYSAFQPVGNLLTGRLLMTLWGHPRRFRRMHLLVIAAESMGDELGCNSRNG
jgi:hypothetical protein